MSITLNIDESLFDHGEGKVVVEVSGNTVRECLDYVVKRRPSLKKAIFDERGNIHYDNLVRVNEDYVSSDRLSKPVKDGDGIEIVKLTGG